VDFTSAPTRRKPIALAFARLVPGGIRCGDGESLLIERIERHADWPTFERWLAAGRWIAAFDFPFGLPREFVGWLGWPLEGERVWAEVTRRVAALSRDALVERCRAFCAPRPAGSKFAHRATDGPAGSSPSMKWVNPPVVRMLHAGAPRLLACGATLPGLLEPAAADVPCAGGRIALEGYPGLLARDVLGRASYKSDDPRKAGAARRAAREQLVAALEAGRHRCALRVDLGTQRAACLEEAAADGLDAVLCAVQAAWAWQRRGEGFGLPGGIDPLEGWIVGA
jgi:hypothetical protein